MDYGGLSEEEIANLSEAEMRAIVEENLRKKLNSNSSSLDTDELGIDEAKIRAEIEAKKRRPGSQGASTRPGLAVGLDLMKNRNLFRVWQPGPGPGPAAGQVLGLSRRRPVLGLS